MEMKDYSENDSLVINHLEKIEPHFTIHSDNFYMD